MSAKKDAFGNIGGFLAIRDPRARGVGPQPDGDHRGISHLRRPGGRDLEALAIGLEEILDEDYLTYRLRSTEYFGEGIQAAGIKVIRPIGGHAVYIDAGAALPHIPWNQYPGQSLSVALYRYIGIRSVEVGLRHARLPRPEDRRRAAGSAGAGPARHPAAGVHAEPRGLHDRDDRPPCPAPWRAARLRLYLPGAGPAALHRKFPAALSEEET